jgi:hypothetical protein
MAKRLSQTQQRYILNSLPATRKTALKKYCRACEQHGDGIKDILKKVGAFLGPIAKDVGPKILKEFIIPLLLKKAQEKYGIDPAGQGLSPAGGSLKLAGQGKKTSPWILHVKKVSKEKGISYKEAMKVAKSTYKTKS